MMVAGAVSAARVTIRGIRKRSASRWTGNRKKRRAKQAAAMLGPELDLVSATRVRVGRNGAEKDDLLSRVAVIYSLHSLVATIQPRLLVRT